MKALVYTQPETLTYQAWDMPRAGDGDVLVKVAAAGICGSDMHAFLGHDDRRPAPLILGHEAAGTVIGGADDGLRVTINPLVTCGTCRFCKAGRDNICENRQIISMPPRHGAFANYVALPRKNVVALPDHVSFEQAALVEPIACGWHGGALALGHLPLHPKDITCCVLGGGAIGVGAALSLAAMGVQTITLVEPNPLRRANLQSRFDFHVTEDVPAGLSADLVVDAVGYAKTREMASACAAPGGIIIHIGLGQAEGGLDVRRMTLQEIQFVGTYTYTSADFVATANALSDGKLGSLDWVEFRPLSEGQSAFDDIRQGKVAAPKIILIPESEE
jgi:L-iditol 2-dehydrogenase